jgi:uncharacterized RDD family membrane protein YckC
VTRTSSAGFGRRFAALVYDGFLLIAVLMPYTWVMVLIHGGAVTQASGRIWWAYRAGALLIIAAYNVLNWVRSGQTLGMRAWRLCAVSDSGGPLRAGRAVARFCWALVAWAPFALGVVWLYADPEHLALQDRLSRTRVVVLARSRDRDQGAKSEDRRGQPADQHGVHVE